MGKIRTPKEISKYCQQNGEGFKSIIFWWSRSQRGRDLGDKKGIIKKAAGKYLFLVAKPQRGGGLRDGH